MTGNWVSILVPLLLVVAMALAGGITGCKPVPPPDAAMAECIKAGKTPSWFATSSSARFECK